MTSTMLTLSLIGGSISMRFEPFLFVNQYARLLDIVDRCPTLEELRLAVSAFAEVEHLQLSVDAVPATLEDMLADKGTSDG